MPRKKIEPEPENIKIIEEDKLQGMLADAVLSTAQTAKDEEAIDRMIKKLRAFPVIPEVYTHADIDEIRKRQSDWIINLMKQL
jgi:hypothetical protein